MLRLDEIRVLRIFFVKNSWNLTSPSSFRASRVMRVQPVFETIGVVKVTSNLASVKAATCPAPVPVLLGAYMIMSRKMKEQTCVEKASKKREQACTKKACKERATELEATERPLQEFKES